MADNRERTAIRKDARKRYGIESRALLSDSPAVSGIAAARELARRINRGRDLSSDPSSAVRAADLNAAALIDEILHHVVTLYRREYGNDLISNAADTVQTQVGKDELTRCFEEFSETFDPVSADEEALKELLMVWVQNQNAACRPFETLFHDDDLEQKTAYSGIVDAARHFFQSAPGFGPDDEPLPDMLTAPARLFPDSLEKQLLYIRERWGHLLGEYLFRLLRGLDYLREEKKAGFTGPGPTHAHTYTYDGLDPERFSPDREWMPNAVMIAKSSLVWLDQLSRTYERSVERLDQIPDEELDRLASFGINALWLIGLWERSPASRRIKHIGGNPEAEASAYALYEYEIAGALGGWPALHNLKERCNQRGIRIASDMVPNHTGIDGRWVIEHPDWFIQSEHPPFAGYSFSGEDLSNVPGVGLRLEDHYYDRSDAAVVFQRTDYETGRNRFIYHGNDGTSMPWNDTAQLDFLNAEVREAVIQTILHVARSFSIIRFDAAMTLAKKHIRRLWYPQPGEGGDIPSRSEFGLTEEEFERRIPQEFWREVVDRVAEEVPDTLLLAEAFWMMEGYFVRTLGMHRVYNSAFMNMLKNEENSKYRQTIKNTIEFDKDILKRFVNFMNNPDEETALAQFGKGDKYFGVFTLMATMPGLPMIGHGQIESFSEKYGMEFRRAYRDEQPDQDLISRHRREIFPLLRRRHLFSSVENFLLYDLYSEKGHVNENVFVYSNQSGGERSLVMYNNSFERAAGWIRSSAGYVEKVNGSREHRRRDLAEALGLHSEHGYYLVFRDVKSGLWFIRRSVEIHGRGLFLSLDGYQAQVFLDIHEIRDNEFGHYAQLADELAGRGVPDVQDALRDVALRPLLDLFSGVANSRVYSQVSAALSGEHTLGPENLARVVSEYARFLRLASEYRDPSGDPDDATADLEELLVSATEIPFLDLRKSDRRVSDIRKAIAIFETTVKERADIRDHLVTWILTAPLGRVYRSAAAVADEWALAERARRAYHSESGGETWPRLLRLLLATRGWWRTSTTVDALLSELVLDSEVTDYLGFNEYEGVVWFNEERFDDLAWWLFATGAIDICAGGSGCGELLGLYDVYTGLLAAERESGFQVEKLLAAAGATPPASGEAPPAPDPPTPEDRT